MSEATATADLRPPMALRIGITGTRQIPENLEPYLRSEVSSVLCRIRDQAAKLAKHSIAKRIYKKTPAGACEVKLQVVSPLAEGADRLIAEEGRKAGYALVAPLPFAQEEYEKDFAATRDAFRALLAQATVVELDGGRGADETASYEAVGHFVAENCDLLITIWDGQMTGKRGGTSEITRFAVEMGVPIWWIEPGSTSGGRWLGDMAQWTDRLASARKATAGSIEDYIADIVLPPAVEKIDDDNVIGHMAFWIRRMTMRETEPLLVFLSEKPRPAGKPLARRWRFYSTIYAYLAPRKKDRAPVVMIPTAPMDPRWDLVYERADKLSIDYADRTRSSYLLIITSAFAIGSMSAIGTLLAEHHHKLITTAAELALLIVIGVIAIANHVSVWHERWINYRLLAELCRAQSILAPIGEKLPRPEVSRLAASTEGVGEALPRDVWVAWFVEVVSRAAMWPQRASRSAKAHAFGLGMNLARDQENYHVERSRRSEIADRRLGDLGGTFFLITLCLILARFLFLAFSEHHELAEFLEGLATILSAASAAFVATKFYLEFGLLDRQSQRMRRNMSVAMTELDSLDLDVPLSSLELARVLQGLTTSMLLDVGGWAELFRIRAVEAG